MLDQALRAANDDGAGSVGAVSSKALSVALVGNFTPRLCGIATFTRDVHEALTGADKRLVCNVVALTDEGAAYAYPGAVTHEIQQNELADYARVAAAIDASGADLLCLQHEFGIFGGPAGEHVLTLLYNVKCPVVTTLHTVLQAPTDAQRRVMSAIIARSAKLIVMAEKGREILRRVYDAPEAKIAVVPHGAPDRPLLASAGFKPALGLEGRDVLLTFGLLSPNKGIETVIRAMPAIKAARPNATYVVLGATHPHLVAQEGEAYRDRLNALAETCGGDDTVRFVNAFVDHDTLLNYLSAADLYVTPYLNEAQITSGTLSYAVALGKPVISTRYWHAQEVLADGAGFLVDFHDSPAIADIAIDLLSDPARRDLVRANAYRVGRATVWDRLAERYLALFHAVSAPVATRALSRPLAHSSAHSPARAAVRAEPPAPTLAGVARMSDACGILQHTSYGVVDRAHGYCLDDNARALVLIHRFEAGGGALGPHEDLTGSYAAFVHHAWNEERARFRNFMAYDRRWLEEAGSDDSFGRGLWAIGETILRGARAEMREWAEALGQRVLPHIGAIGSLRARAFCALGLAPWLEAKPDESRAAVLTGLAEDLAQRVRGHRTEDWVWFENYLAYDNARLPEGLIRAGLALDRPDLVAPGLDALDWLCTLQTAPSGLFRPVGVAGIGMRAGRPAPFDQQPVEAAATIDACAAAFEASGDLRWIRDARRAYDWFLGANDLGAPLVDAARGVCHDGLTPERVNKNQGAESVLSFQLATCAMHALSRAARISAPRALVR